MFNEDVTKKGLNVIKYLGKWEVTKKLALKNKRTDDYRHNPKAFDWNWNGITPTDFKFPKP